MATDMTLRIKSTTSGQTEHLAETLGSNLRGGEVIELQSDLGGGKTTFTRGLARGAGSLDTVTSPSFTLSKEYQAKNFTIRHYDYYRLEDPGIMGFELSEIAGNPAFVTVIEWGEIVSSLVPDERVIVKIERGETDEDRILSFTVPANRLYLIEGVGI